MNKKELTTKMSKDAGITHVQARKALTSLLNGINNSLQRGERVTISGFGSFEIKQRRERMGRNPKTGEVIRISPKKRVKFNPSPALEDKL